MVNGLIRWSLNNRALVVALIAILFSWGGYVATTVPVDVLPDLTAPTVTLVAESPGMAPSEMESLVTFPLETALNGASGVRRVRSATAVGVAVVWVEFDWGQNIQLARQVVTEKLNLARGSLPPETEVVMAPISSIMGEILFVALESDRYSPLDLRTIADTTVRRRLLAIPGVAQVIPTGGAQKQYQVLLSPTRLKAYNLSLHQVEASLQDANQNASAGFYVAGGQEYLIQGIGRASTATDIEQTVVTSRDGRPILIRDLGEVRIGEALKRAEGSHNAEAAIILGIQKQPGINTLKLTKSIDTVLDQIQQTLPEGVSVNKHVFRQADFIETAVENLLAALREGGLVVLVVVVLFLANFRASVITLLAIPLSLIAAVWSLQVAGLTINAMSLGGLAIAIGALVDDAIIDVENVFRRLRENNQKPPSEGLPVLEVVYRASVEVRSSIVFATFIIVLVFVPLFLLESVEGRLLAPLGFAYVIALAASLIVALTITPALCSLLLPRAKMVLEGREPWLVKRLKQLYQPTLRWAVNHSLAILIASGLLLTTAVFSFHWMGRAFLPEFNEGALTIQAVTLPGTSLAESDQLGRQLERILLTVPEVASTARRTGRAELDEHVQGVESAEIDATLKMRDRPKEVVLADIRRRVTLLPGVNVTVGGPIAHRIDHMLSGTRANIAVKIFGDELPTLRAMAKQVETLMQGIPGVVDLSIEQQMDIPTLRVHFDRPALARYGLPAGTAAESLQTALLGRQVGQILEGQVAFPLVVRYQTDDAQDLDSIRRTLLDTPAGAQIPLASVSEIRDDRAPNFISRENVQRKIVVQCNVAGRDLRSVVNDIQEVLQASVALPRGYHIEYGGQFESESEASQRLLWLGAMVVVGIFILLFSAFRSLRDALIIMLNLPLALVGGVIGVFISGGVLSVASLIGFITLFGIATRNGIMLISHVRHLMEVEGVEDLKEAVVRGSLERLAPILMTALAAGLALVPIVYRMGEAGNEIQAPMAIVILFGLLSSTALNMVVVPSVYARFGKRPA
ncbi:MAG: efflux RND transporter permease subunit [Acidobacteria bacterium]|nr:efflux RND transporter permease subunit [Acidobacteriota bacterium]